MSAPPDADRPLYLSRILLDPRHRGVHRDLADCQALHRTVMAAFPPVAATAAADPRAALGVLFRLETHPRTGGPALVVQALAPPDWSALRRAGYLLPAAAGDGPPVKDVSAGYAALRPGLRLRFRLRANPTRRLSTPRGPDGARPAGKRVDLRDDDARMAWLERKGRDHGFALVRSQARPDIDLPNVRATPEQPQSGYRPGGEGETARRTMTFGAVLFEGELAVVDADALRRALAEGIGPGKAYGFGLLSLAPAAPTAPPAPPEEG